MNVLKQYHSLGKVPLDEVLPLIASKLKVEFFGERVNVKSLRLRTFKQKGVDCVCCGAKGSHFIVASKNGSTYHLCLVAKRTDGFEILMTRDHIQPLAKGGADTVENSQPMCIKCNSDKADQY